MSQLPVEHFRLLDADFHVVGMSHEDIVVLFGVHLHQCAAQSLIGPLDIPEGSFELSLR